MLSQTFVVDRLALVMKPEKQTDPGICSVVAHIEFDVVDHLFSA